jgi:hypothetical protein
VVLFDVVVGLICNMPDPHAKKFIRKNKYGVCFKGDVDKPAPPPGTRDMRVKEWLYPDDAAAKLRLVPGVRAPPQPRAAAAAEEGQSSDGDVDMVGSITEEEEEEHDASGTVDDDRRGKVWIEKKEEVVSNAAGSCLYSARPRIRSAQPRQLPTQVMKRSLHYVCMYGM